MDDTWTNLTAKAIMINPFPVGCSCVKCSPTTRHASWKPYTTSFACHDTSNYSYYMASFIEARYNRKLCHRFILQGYFHWSQVQRKTLPLIFQQIAWNIHTELYIKGFKNILSTVRRCEINTDKMRIIKKNSLIDWSFFTLLSWIEMNGVFQGS